MEIKFNNFLILESSFLSKLGIDKSIISFLHKKYDIKYNEQLLELNSTDLLKDLKKVLTDNNIIFAIKNKEIFIICNNTFKLNENNKLLLEDEEEEEEGYDYEEDNYSTNITLDKIYKNDLKSVTDFFSKKIKELSTFEEDAIKSNSSDEDGYDPDYEDEDDNMNESILKSIEYDDEDSDDEDSDDDKIPDTSYIKKLFAKHIIDQLYKNSKDKTTIQVIDKNNNIENNVNLEEFIKEHNDFKYYKLVLKNKLEKKNLYTSTEIKKLFISRYEIIFIKIIDKYLIILKDIIKNNINRLELTNKESLQYNNLLSEDIIKLRNFKFNFTTEYSNVYYFIDKLNLDIKDINDNNIDYLLKYMCYVAYYNLNKSLEFKKQQKISSLLEKDPSIWQKIKHNFYDKQLRDNWKHLDNADNFDLI